MYVLKLQHHTNFEIAYRIALVIVPPHKF